MTPYLVPKKWYVRGRDRMVTISRLGAGIGEDRWSDPDEEED